MSLGQRPSKRTQASAESAIQKGPLRLYPLVLLPHLRKSASEFTKSYPFRESCANAASSTTSVMSGIEAQFLIESRLQRLLCGGQDSWGVAPSLNEAAPLALNNTT
jgi:hypothetical protein